MSKDFIKKKLRESLNEKAEAQSKEKNDTYDTDYKEVQNKLLNGVLKASQIMAKAGLGKADNATDRSLFGKKLHQAKNDDGSVYRFSAEELKALKHILSNPNSVTKSK